jgi:hypothetical protein
LGVGTTLETIVVPGQEVATSRPTTAFLRSAPLRGLVILVVTAMWLVLPVRTELGRSELRQLQHQWSEIQALDDAKTAIINDQLRPAAGPDDTARLDLAVAALDREQMAVLDAVHRRLAGELVVDTQLRRLRAEMVRTIALEMADLEQSGSFYSTKPDATVTPPKERRDPTMLALADLQAVLLRERRRFSVAPGPPAVVGRLTSADPALAVFSHLLDEPTGTALVAVTATGTVVVDLDANLIVPARLEGSPATAPTSVMARQGYLLLRKGPIEPSDQSEFFAIDSHLDGPLRPLGPARAAVPATSATGVWLQRPDATAVEVDGAGAMLDGPVRLPPGASIEGAVDTGLVLVTRGDDGRAVLDIWAPDQARTVRRLSVHVRQVVATNHDEVVWIDEGGPRAPAVHLVSVSTGHDRLVGANLGLQPWATGWAFSPDGSKLVSTWREPAQNGNADAATWVLGFVDLTTGRVDLLAPGSVQGGAGPTGAVWSTNSERVFLPGSIGANGPSVATVALGSGNIEHLRFRGAPILTVAVITD